MVPHNANNKTRRTKKKIKTGVQVVPNLPGKKRRCHLTHSASLVFSVFRETRWAEDGGRMYVVRVLEGAEGVGTAAGESGENMGMLWGTHSEERRPGKSAKVRRFFFMGISAVISNKIRRPHWS